MKKLFLITFFCSVLLSNCNKIDLGRLNPYNNFDIYQVPHTLFFLVKENNQRLSDNVLDSCKLSYYSGGVKTYMSDFLRAVNDTPYLGRNLGILTTRNIGFTSGKNHIKDYYLEYPNGSVDSLYVDYGYYDNNDDASNDPCKCLYPLKQVKYNGKVAPLDSSITIQTVYSFIKN